MMFITLFILLWLILQSLMMIHSFIHTYDEILKYHNRYHLKNYPSSIYSNRNDNQIPFQRSKIRINNINNTNKYRYNSKQQQQQQQQIKYTSLTKYEDQSIKSWSITDSFNSTTLKLLFDIKVK